MRESTEILAAARLKLEQLRLLGDFGSARAQDVMDLALLVAELAEHMALMEKPVLDLDKRLAMVERFLVPAGNA
jgi:hypothetical protein